MATMPSFLSRLARPFTATHINVVPTGAGAAPHPANTQKLTVAAGCFWGVEHMFRRQFGGAGDGLVDAKVGYTGGRDPTPTYRSVCSGRSGHAEALQVLFDPGVVSYGQLVEFFYRMHDPTTRDRQGPDGGSQYRSAIFWHDGEQERVAKDVTERVNRQWYKGQVVTEVVEAGAWYDAEAYHQLYLDKNPGGYECPSHFLRKFPPLE